MSEKAETFEVTVALEGKDENGNRVEMSLRLNVPGANTAENRNAFGNQVMMAVSRMALQMAHAK